MAMAMGTVTATDRSCPGGPGNLFRVKAGGDRAA